MSKDTSVMWRLPVLDHMRLLHATYIEHSFTPHAHEYYVIGLIERGVQRFDHGHKHFVTYPQQLIVINPDEIHTGEAAIPEGFVYRALYPTKTLMRAFAEEMNSGGLPTFQTALVHDPMMYRRFQQLHRAARQEPLPLALEVEFGEALFDLVAAHAQLQYTPTTPNDVRREVRLAQDYLTAHYAMNVSLHELASLVNISPYHFARLFRKQTGLPPHKYLENVRVQHAQSQLERGVPIAQVAYDTGFANQGHLTRTFKRVMGVTPGLYAKNSKII